MHVEEPETELLKLIYTRIGTIMEDASVIALELGGPKSTFEPAKVNELQKSVNAIAALLDAADALHE